MVQSTVQILCSSATVGYLEVYWKLLGRTFLPYLHNKHPMRTLIIMQVAHF